MFLDKLLNKIPFFRKRRIAKIKKELVEIGADFADGFFNEKYVASLHNIVNSPLIAFSEEIVSGTIDKITMYSKTSVSAVKLLERKAYKKSELERTPLLSTSKNTVFFSDWYSNEESVNDFIGMLKPYLQVQVWLAHELEYDQHDKIAEALYNSSELIDMELYESLLYRLLLEDLVSIISFYLETQYE